jgi:hypothetical protein
MYLLPPRHHPGPGHRGHLPGRQCRHPTGRPARSTRRPRKAPPATFPSPPTVFTIRGDVQRGGCQRPLSIGGLLIGSDSSRTLHPGEEARCQQQTRIAPQVQVVARWSRPGSRPRRRGRRRYADPGYLDACEDDVSLAEVAGVVAGPSATPTDLGACWEHRIVVDAVAPARAGTGHSGTQFRSASRCADQLSVVQQRR